MTDRISPINVRAYESADWPRLCAIHDAAWLDELRFSAGEAAFLMLEQTAENEGLFNGQLDVAEIDGVVEGFVAYSDEELTWLYVNPACNRRGVGRALLRHALSNAGPGFRIEVLEGNEPALCLYLDEGFQIAELIDGRLEGNEDFAAVGCVLEYHSE